MTLRSYQRETIDALYSAYGAGHRRVATVLPCGAGKTYVFSHVVRDAVATGGRALVLAHRTELIEQAAAELRNIVGAQDVGILQGAKREFSKRVIVASIATACRPGALAVLQQLGIRLIVCDEVHHVAAVSYQTILRELRAFEPDGPRFYGVTATLGRGDGKALGETIEHVAHVVPPQELIAAGILLRPLGVRVKIAGMDLSRVKRSKTSVSGLDDRAVAGAMHDALAPQAIARAVLEHGAGRRGVAFLPSVELSKEQAQAFTDAGLKAVHVDADTPRQQRTEIMRRARLGEYDMVCNVGLFTEGTNVPIWDMVVMGRPTSSAVLFEQMLWRAGRAYGEQRDFLALDVVGVTGRHKLVQLVSLEGVEMIDELDDELKQFDEEEFDDATDMGALPADPSPPGVDGDLDAELFDLFGKSSARWQRSPRGLWYLPTGDTSAVVLRPIGAGEYDILTNAGELLHEDPQTLTLAMAYGEQHAPPTAYAGQGWRTRQVPARERSLAAYYGGGVALQGMGAYIDAKDANWARRHVDNLLGHL